MTLCKLFLSKVTFYLYGNVNVLEYRIYVAKSFESIKNRYVYQVMYIFRNATRSCISQQHYDSLEPCTISSQNSNAQM